VTPGRTVPGDGLLHALPLGALAVLVLNDHWWKRAHPSWVTGKLSDVAGMIFFPLLLQALWEVGRALAGTGWGPSKRALVVAVTVTVVVFTLAKTWPPMNAWVRAGDAALRWPLRLAWAAAHDAPAPVVGSASLARDPTDLVALPAALLGLWVGLRRAAG
jgi:hypothetical protein